MHSKISAVHIILHVVFVNSSIRSEDICKACEPHTCTPAHVVKRWTDYPANVTAS